MLWFKKKERSSPIQEGLLYALCVVIYVSAIATLMYNGGNLFGKKPGVLGGIAFLLLFVLSAMIVGSLLLGKPAILYLEGQKKASIQLLFAIMGWLFLILLLVFLSLLVLS